MTVNPGFGGQQYLPETEGKIRSLRRLLDQRDRFVDLEVDGGITAASAPRAVAAGARVLVAGSSAVDASMIVAEATGFDGATLLLPLLYAASPTAVGAPVTTVAMLAHAFRITTRCRA